MFAIGDKVVHPRYGAGTIVDIEEKRMGGEAARYYIIELIGRPSRLMVPVDNADNIGLRPPIRQIQRVFQVLTEEPVPLPSDHRARREQLTELLRTGDPLLIGEVLRNLAWRDHRSRLTEADSKLYQQAQNFLAGELAASQGIDLEEARGQLLSALDLPNEG